MPRGFWGLVFSTSAVLLDGESWQSLQYAPYAGQRNGGLQTASVGARALRVHFLQPHGTFSTRKPHRKPQSLTCTALKRVANFGLLVNKHFFSQINGHSQDFWVLKNCLTVTSSLTNWISCEYEKPNHAWNANFQTFKPGTAKNRPPNREPQRSTKRAPKCGAVCGMQAVLPGAFWSPFTLTDKFLSSPPVDVDVSQEQRYYLWL